MAFTKQQLDFLKKHFNFDKLKSLGKSTEEAANAVFGKAQESPKPSVPSPDNSTEEAANAVFGEAQASPYDPLRLQAINSRMEQAAKMKFPSAWLRQVKGLVDSGKLDEAEISLDRWEYLASEVGADALQGEQYVMKSMGDNYIRDEKNATEAQMSEVYIDGIRHVTRPGGAKSATSYMTTEQTEASKVNLEDSDAGTKLTQQGKERKAVTGENIFVMDGEGKIMAQKSPPTLPPGFDPDSLAKDNMKRFVSPHHSNFLRGEDVAGAGELHTDDDGILKKVTDQSGHYLPDAVHTQQVLASLEEQGANLNNVKFKASKTKTEGMAKEFQQGVTVEQFEKRHRLIDELKGKFKDDEGKIVDSESKGTKMFLDAQNKANLGRTTFFRLFDFDIEYPVVLTNKSWQKKKGLKDKVKTKTGLGDLLTRAEESWAKIDFETLHPKMTTDTSFLNNSSALAEAKKTAVAQKGALAAVANALTAVGDKAKQIAGKDKISEDARATATEIKHAAYGLAAPLSKYSVEKAYDNAIKLAKD